MEHSFFPSAHPFRVTDCIGTHIELSEVAPGDVPDTVADEWRSYSTLYAYKARPLSVQEFPFVRIARTADGIDTYIAGMRRSFEDREGVEPEDDYKLIDMHENELIGSGELRVVQSNKPYYKDKPFVGMTRNELGYSGIGLGRRRLFVMQALSLAIAGHPLHSDTLITDDAAAVWQKLIADSVAEPFIEPSLSNQARTRYRFKA